MKTSYPENWPQFFTATIQECKHLLEKDKYKDIIINSLKLLVDTNKVKAKAKMTQKYNQVRLRKVDIFTQL